ncbi:hypothetical protein RA210_U30319 [Rubrivivax sp. A210]|uniref:hypothetical protein n=1 Tax=Rubrivivax sp. A210 TaxID=2772301 RepID=UPI001917ADC0|nr:hypothetical protein [Rubrivivax sp. A210]CAD5373407.1 hypothetical protein RA210_U30319 [Rubrivivax sp. A210]
MLMSLATAPRSTAPGGLQTAADEHAAGCGWFDSSHDLRTGLLVREHEDAAVLARELPLVAWLDLQCLGRLN